ncbi:hypothetical protein [Mycolicibacterium sp. D5.8-2]|uniref:hypothetical protein n=1 Tax=Mycolicibacterium sp. D5.8-2 TaxID=3085903 RepID=UPI0012DDDD7A|nr:hypothetical protein [Mycolicibacterium sp. D5.8-2]MDW5613904.1 hypothetical protein [Mycolicibacterium sp. D5.8-2]
MGVLLPGVAIGDVPAGVGEDPVRLGHLLGGISVVLLDAIGSAVAQVREASMSNAFIESSSKDYESQTTHENT